VCVDLETGQTRRSAQASIPRPVALTIFQTGRFILLFGITYLDRNNSDAMLLPVSVSSALLHSYAASRDLSHIRDPPSPLFYVRVDAEVPSHLSLDHYGLLYFILVFCFDTRRICYHNLSSPAYL